MRITHPKVLSSYLSPGMGLGIGMPIPLTGMGWVWVWDGIGLGWYGIGMGIPDHEFPGIIGEGSKMKIRQDPPTVENDRFAKRPPQWKLFASAAFGEDHTLWEPPRWKMIVN